MKAYMIAPEVKTAIGKIFPKGAVDSHTIDAKLSGFMLDGTIVEVPMENEMQMMYTINKHRELGWVSLSIPETAEELATLQQHLKSTGRKIR